MPLGAHERAPAPPGRLRPPRAHRRRQSACELRIASPEPGRTELFESVRRAAASVRCLCCRRQALLEPRRIRGSCLGRQRELAPHARRALRQGSRAESRVENYCLPRATLTVLLGGLTGRYTRRRWRKSGASCCRLSGQMPRTKGASEEARGRRWTRRIRRWRARGVQQWKELSCYIQHRRHRSSQPFSRAASGSRPSGCPP